MTTTTILVLTSICTAIFASVTAPLILAHRTEKMHREDQLEQYKREDRVAEVARKAADDLVASQRVIADQAAEAARLLAVNNELVAHTSHGIAQQLGAIHILVNSNLTRAKQAELTALRGQLALVNEIISLKTGQGAGISVGTREAKLAIERQVAELAGELADRAAADAQLAAEEERGGDVTLVILLYPDGQRREVILAGVPHLGETIRLKGRSEPLLVVEHVLWMEASNGHEPVALVSVRASPPH